MGLGGELKQEREAQERRSAGAQERRSAGAQECRSAGAQERRSAGVQERRNAETTITEGQGSGVVCPRHIAGVGIVFFSQRPCRQSW